MLPRSFLLAHDVAERHVPPRYKKPRAGMLRALG